MYRSITSFVCALSLSSIARAEEAKPNTIDHAGLIQAWDQASFERGQTIYDNLCINCHGANGKTPSLPVARAFGTGELKFGGDPYAMFRTLTCLLYTSDAADE